MARARGVAREHWDEFVDAPALAELARRQAENDTRLIAFCDALDAAGCVASERGRAHVSGSPTR